MRTLIAALAALAVTGCSVSIRILDALPPPRDPADCLHETAQSIDVVLAALLAATGTVVIVEDQRQPASDFKDLPTLFFGIPSLLLAAVYAGILTGE